LALVHSLDISDKHGVLLMTGVAVRAEKTKGLQFGASIESGIFPAFVDGASVMQVRLPGGELQAPQLQSGVFLKVTLANRPNAPIVLLLRDLLNRVTQVIVDLTRFARP
jgi:hypothetical protein